MLPAAGLAPGFLWADVPVDVSLVVGLCQGRSPPEPIPTSQHMPVAHQLHARVVWLLPGMSLENGGFCGVALAVNTVD